MGVKTSAFIRDPQGIGEKIEDFNRDVFLNYFDGNFFEAIGLDSKRDAKGRDQAGTLRVYEFNAQGELFDPFAKGDTLTSNGFLDKVKQGKIIAFPSGEKKPVQIQILGDGLEFSVPLDELPISPKPPEPKPLTGWQKFARAVTFGLAYRGAKAKYDRQVAARQTWQEKATGNLNKLVEKRTEAVLDTEKGNFERDVAQRQQAVLEEAAADEKRKADQQVDDLQSGKFRYEVDKYRSLYQAYCGPKPERRESLVGEGKSFTKEEFNVLETYELPQGPNLEGTEITDKEFAALSILNASSEKHGGTFKADELPPDMSPSEVAVTRTMMFTESMIHSPDAPRGNMGQVLKDVYEPSREEVFEAVKEYRVKGNREQLAGLIAKGMNFFQHRFEGKAIGDPGNLTTAALVSEAAALLERDPKLKDAVMAVTGEDGQALVTDEDLVVAKGFTKALELTRKNEEARIMLHAESVGAAQLTDQERQGYIKDRLAFETIQYSSQLSLTEQTTDPKYVEGFEPVHQAYTQAVEEENRVAAKMSTNKNPAETEKLSKQYDEAYKERERCFRQEDFYKATHIQAPKTLGMLGKHGDKIVETLMQGFLPGTEKLNQLKGEALEEALEGNRLFAANSPYRQKPDQTKGNPELDAKETGLGVKGSDKTTGGPNL